VDPFAGNNQDPQSLHKYLYCHANPVNNIDPSGQFTFKELVVAIAIIAVVLAVVLFVYRWAVRPMSLMAQAQPMDEDQVRNAIAEMQQPWWRNVTVDGTKYSIRTKMLSLASWLSMEADIGFLYRVQTIDAPEDDITGLNFGASPYLCVSEQVVANRNALEIAIVIFGEYQHNAQGGGLGEQAAMDEFVIMRRQIPEDLRTEFINTRYHRGTENVQ
jgi:hypothetical protein